MTDTLTADKNIVNAYERLWPNAKRIRNTAYNCGGARPAKRAGDYLGLDLLNGGLREVWSLADCLGINNTSEVLEIGSGIGGPARFIAERYQCRVFGVDLTPHQVQVALDLGKGLRTESKIHFILGDTRRLPFHASVFTHVYSIEALIHVYQKRFAIQEAFRVLRPGGLLCIRDPVGKCNSEIRLLEKTLHPMSLEDYKTALEEAGFCDIAAVDYTEQSMEAYKFLRQLVSRQSISPATITRMFDRIHPGIRPPIWRNIVPWRIHHTLRYLLNHNKTALDLLGNREHVQGVFQMCNDIVSSYSSGALRLYQVHATKPNL